MEQLCLVNDCDSPLEKEFFDFYSTSWITPVWTCLHCLNKWHKTQPTVQHKILGEIFFLISDLINDRTNYSSWKLQQKKTKICHCELHIKIFLHLVEKSVYQTNRYSQQRTEVFWSGWDFFQWYCKCTVRKWL